VWSKSSAERKRAGDWGGIIESGMGSKRLKINKRRWESRTVERSWQQRQSVFRKAAGREATFAKMFWSLQDCALQKMGGQIGR